MSHVMHKNGIEEHPLVSEDINYRIEDEGSVIMELR